MKRVLTAVLLIPVVVGLVFWAPHPAVRATLAVVALLCQHEFLKLASGYGALAAPIVAYVASAWVVAAPLEAASGAPFLLGVTLLLLALTLRGGRDLPGAMAGAAATLLGIVYIALPFRLAADLHARNPHWLFYTLLLNWVGDTAAYYIGTAVGRHKLAPRISPGKSWEGAAASALAAGLVGPLYLRRFLPQSMAAPLAVGLSLAVNLAAQIGDLAESALKRGAGVKDSGALLPGHGGFLDRLDGVIFSVLVVWAAS